MHRGTEQQPHSFAVLVAYAEPIKRPDPEPNRFTVDPTNIVTFSISYDWHADRSSEFIANAATDVESDVVAHCGSNITANSGAESVANPGTVAVAECESNAVADAFAFGCSFKSEKLRVHINMLTISGRLHCGER